MPTRKHGTFSNDRRLSKEDRDTLLAWIKQDCPKGDPRDLPPAHAFPKGWTIGEPDAVFAMPKEFNVPAEGGKNGIRYQYFPVRYELRRGPLGAGRRGAAGQSRRRASHHRLRAQARPGDAAEPHRRHRRRFPRRLRAGRAARRVRAGHGQEGPQGGQAPLPDALHAQRRRAEGPFVGRPDLRQAAAQARGAHARHRAAAGCPSRPARATTKSSPRPPSRRMLGC